MGTKRVSEGRPQSMGPCLGDVPSSPLSRRRGKLASAPLLHPSHLQERPRPPPSYPLQTQPRCQPSSEKNPSFPNPNFPPISFIPSSLNTSPATHQSTDRPIEKPRITPPYRNNGERYARHQHHSRARCKSAPPWPLLPFCPFARCPCSPLRPHTARGSETTPRWSFAKNCRIAALRSLRRRRLPSESNR